MPLLTIRHCDPVILIKTHQVRGPTSNTTVPCACPHLQDHHVTTSVSVSIRVTLVLEAVAVDPGLAIGRL